MAAEAQGQGRASTQCEVLGAVVLAAKEKDQGVTPRIPGFEPVALVVVLLVGLAVVLWLLEWKRLR